MVWVRRGHRDSTHCDIFPNEIADFGKRNLPFPVTAGLEGEGGHAGASHALFNFAAMFS